jgi:hypothetical protein
LVYVFFDSMRALTPSDTIVLRVVEYDDTPQTEDTDIYVLFDTYNDLFLVRGKRSDTPKIYAIPYSFECKSRYSVYSFLSLLIPKEHKCTVELYNYPGLPSDKNEITFDYLRENRSPSNELVAYTEQRVLYNNIMNILDLMQDVANDYHP